MVTDMLSDVSLPFSQLDLGEDWVGVYVGEDPLTLVSVRLLQRPLHIQNEISCVDDGSSFCVAHPEPLSSPHQLVCPSVVQAEPLHDPR